MKTLIALLAMTVAAQAEQPFQCFTADSVHTINLSSDQVRANNFSIRERKAMIGKMNVVEVAYSVTNLTNRVAYTTGAFVGITKAGEVTFALSASPVLDMLQPSMTDTAKNNVYVAAGSLERTYAVCVNVMSESR